MQRLKGYAEVKIVGMQYHYKTSDGYRLPNPLPGCPLSLQLEPSNQHHRNAIKVINDTDTRHLGYIVRKTADILTPLLNDNSFASARAFLCGTHDQDQNTISCQVLLFCSVQYVCRLPPWLRFHDDLSSPDFVFADTLVDFTGCTLHEFDEYMASLDLQSPLRPCSTNINSPVHVHDSDATAPLERPPQSQVQVPTDEAHDGTVESDNSVRGPPTEAETQLLDAEMNEIICMKCKQMGRGPVLTRESCIGGVVGHMCLFCPYLEWREEIFRAKKYSDLYVAFKSKYEEARKSAIQFFGKETFKRLRELEGLDPLLPTQVQVPCNANMKCNTKEGRREREDVGTSTIIEKSASKEKKEKAVEKEAVGTSTIIEKSASKKKKEKVVDKEAVGTSTIIEKSASMEKKEKVVEKEAVGTNTIIEKSASKEKKEKRLPPRPSYDRACKKMKQASSLLCQSEQGGETS